MAVERTGIADRAAHATGTVTGLFRAAIMALTAGMPRAMVVLPDIGAARGGIAETRLSTVACRMAPGSDLAGSDFAGSDLGRFLAVPNADTENMNSFKILCTMTIGSMFLAGAVAQAQPAPTKPEQGEVIEVYTDADAGAVLNARIIALRTVLELTPEQEKLWPPVEASIRKIAADSMARGKKRAETAPPADFLDALDRIADSEATRAADLQGFVIAARPLVATLSESQKNRFPAFLGMIADPQSPLGTRSLWLFEEEQR